MKPPIIVRHPEIEGLVEIQYDVFRDHRGQNSEGYNKDYLAEFGDFTVDSYSWSTRSVIRGYHGDISNSKIVFVTAGSIFLSVIDARPESPTYLAVKNFDLNYRDFSQILLPSGVVNAHQCLSDFCCFSYKLTKSYVAPDQQIHIKYNDPRFNIKWPISEPILSDRDK